MLPFLLYSTVFDKVELHFSSLNLARVLQRGVSLSDSELVLVEVMVGSVALTTLDRSSGAMLDQETLSVPWLTPETR